MNRRRYTSPVGGRYGSEEMKTIFSDRYRHSVWRGVWASLALAQSKVGLDITEDQIREMYENKHNIDYGRISQIEEITHHDVMAHIQEFGEVCHTAKPIIHLGATSADIVDNTDIILMAKAMNVIALKIIKLIATMSNMAIEYRSFPTVGYTHLQRAQLTTVGKRICTWIQDLEMDMTMLNDAWKHIGLRGLKGATGTQASFLELVDGDVDKVAEMEYYFVSSVNLMVGLDIGTYMISTQTYPRKVDTIILNVLSNIAQSASKFASDIRLLQHMGEMKEGFSNGQVGSSAMPYKRNPLNCERICSLSRLVQSNYNVAVQNASNQWLERTLDDSANRRIILPESFIIVDEIIETYTDIISNIVVDESTIYKNMNDHKFDTMTENIIMNTVRHNNMDRQKVHEIINEYARNNTGNALISRLSNDDRLVVNKEDTVSVDRLIGMAKQQVDKYIQFIQAEIVGWRDKYEW